MGILSWMRAKLSKTSQVEQPLDPENDKCLLGMREGNDLFYVKPIAKIDNGKGYWSYLKLGVFDGGGNQVGSYVRNYSAIYHTFYPFQQNGKWYALYSKDYTATRVMTLPDCVDLAGEEGSTSGFCPVHYYVPSAEFERDEDSLGLLAGTFGFVAGCVWGDDTSWKIQYLDLSKITEGKLTRDDRFGYIEMPYSVATLAECFNWRRFEDEDPQFTILQDTPFFLDGRDVALAEKEREEKNAALWKRKREEKIRIKEVLGLDVTGWTGIDLLPMVQISKQNHVVLAKEDGTFDTQPHAEWLAKKPALTDVGENVTV